jgi:predicted nucleic acid-binding protein
MLCDVNVLLALVTDRHAAHAIAVRWLDSVTVGGSTICRVAQTGLLRLLNNLAVMREDALVTAAC